MKRTLFFILFNLIFMGVAANQIAQVGIIDYDKIITTFSKESRQLNDFEKQKARYQKEIDKINLDIRNMEERKIEAQQDGDEKKVTSLENSIRDKQKLLSEYVKIAQQKLNDMAQKISISSDFMATIIEEVRIVSESSGYSLVLRKSDPNILWYSRSVDITDAVIERLSARMNR